MTFELLPVRSTYHPAEQPQVEIRGLPQPGTLRMFHLGDHIDSRLVEAGGIASLPNLPPGGYGLELNAGDAVARTAIEVIADGSVRMRYGFVADNRCHHVHLGMPLVIERPVGVPEDSILNINEGGDSRAGVLGWAVHGLIVPDDPDVHTCHILRMPVDPVAKAPANVAMELRKTRVLI